MLTGVCNYSFVIFAKIVIMIWQENQMQVSCLWLHPVAVIWSARIHHSWINTTNQSRGGVSKMCQSLSCIGYWAVPLLVQVRSVCSYLVREVQAEDQPVNSSGEQRTTTTELKNAPPVSRSKRRNKKTDEEKQRENKEMDRAREETRINIRASFQRWRSCGSCKDFSAGQVRTCWIYV